MIQTLYIARHVRVGPWSQAFEVAGLLGTVNSSTRPCNLSGFSCRGQEADCDILFSISQPTSIALGVPIYVDHWISECADILRADFPEIDADGWSNLWYPPSTGENIAQITERMATFLSRFIPEVEATLSPEKHERILLVTHAAPVIALVRNLLGETESRVKPGCCSITEFQRNPNSDSLNWSPRRVGDCGHVSGDTREWGFEDYY
ncbi:phosphoglycerate mutase-like protein [Lentinula aciculospora]|uniref:Phosphoglycerate mutase-like protein n=1 Tax=Lentinula aciculospora TaxID=153920 RepID=A0A9W9ANR8_9AGAR|nr:phosphoglycerate mutase-like protein [Lentinula aciculospora]